MSTARKIAYTSRTADKFVVHLPSGMRDRIAEVARNNHRSMNSEIIARMEQSLNQEEGVSLDSGLRMDSPELSIHERELLQHFRFLYLDKSYLRNRIPWIPSIHQRTNSTRARLCTCLQPAFNCSALLLTY